MTKLSFSGERIDNFEFKIVQQKIMDKTQRLKNLFEGLSEIKCRFKNIHPSEEHDGKIEITIKLRSKKLNETFKSIGFQPQYIIDEILGDIERYALDRKVQFPQKKRFKKK